MCLDFLSDPPWGGSKTGQEGVKESFKDKRLYLECCHSGSGFGQIFQGVDPGRGKKGRGRASPLFDEILLQTKCSQQHTDVLPTTLDTCIYLNLVILVVFFLTEL